MRDRLGVSADRDRRVSEEDGEQCVLDRSIGDEAGGVVHTVDCKLARRAIVETRDRAGSSATCFFS